jgi:poly-gamma-glutamate capsule biosynthesis protein CapA/YwtB (metallophosphatase superfamily)
MLGPMTRIALIGDVMLGRGVAEELARRPAADLWAREVREILRSCDATVCNLECCISGRGERTGRVPGKQFFFRSPPAGVGALESIGVAAAGLANNHALDFEEQALADTLANLDRAAIACAGAGQGRDTARRGAEVAAGGLRLGLVAMSDHPAEYAAREDSWGIAYADLERGAPAYLLAEAARLRDRCDIVIASLHWGPNMVIRPAPWQRRLAAEMAEAGVDLVAGHSAHVFHGVGWSPRGPLLYDLGDALDDYAVDRALRNDLGVLAIWSPGGDPELELVGLRLEFCFTRLARGEDAEWIARRLEGACSELGTRVDQVAEQRFRVAPARSPSRSFRFGRARR